MATSPITDLPSSDKEIDFQSPISLTFTSPHDQDEHSQTPTPLPDLPIPETIPLNNDENTDDLYREYEDGETGSGGSSGTGSPADTTNPFLAKHKPLPLITGDEDVEIDGPDSLPVLDDPYLTLKATGDDLEGLEEPEPIARRDRSRSEAGERDAALAGLAFATHLALQNKSSGLVREDSSEGGLTLIPATPPPTPLSRTGSTTSNVSIRTSSNLGLHTVSEEKMGADGQVHEEEGSGGSGIEGEEEVGSGGLISGGSMVINPPTTPMAASSRTFVVPPQPPVTTHPTVPFTPPTTPQNRTSGAGAGAGPSSTATTTGAYQKPSGFYKPVKPEVKHRSGGGQGVSALIGTVLVSGAPPPTPPVTPANRTSFGHATRPPPIVSHNTLDPAPTPPPTPMSAIGTPTAGVRASVLEGIDNLIPTMSPQIRSRSTSSDGFSEMKSQLLSSSSFGGGGTLAKFSNLSVMTPTSDDESKSPPIVTAPVVACRVAECTGRAFLRGYCPKHWRLARRPSELAENEEKEPEADTTEEGDQDHVAPSTPASLEQQFPWLVNSEDGESHWQEWKENLIQASVPTSTTSQVLSYGSQEFKATNLVIQEYLPKTKTDFECSPVPQLITILAGTFIFEASDGKTKTVNPGNMIFLQDLSGKGHRMTAVGSGKHLFSRTSLESLTTSTEKPTS